MSNVILKPSPFHMKPSTNDDWLHDQYKVVQPVVTDRSTTSRESVPQVARPIAWSPSQSPDQSRDLTAHDRARLMVRPCTTDRTILYDLFATSCDLESWVLSFEHDHRSCCDQICSYDHPRLKINRTICQRFICDSSYFVVVYRS